jgi:2-polyprenylphenol 6-hydroxylase
VRLCCPAQCAALDFKSDRAELTLHDGTKLGARLVVAADGGDSWVRAQAGIAASSRAYRQTGVVANFLAEKPHRGIAFQWFRRDGVLALLPLPGNRVSMVWSCNDELASRLLTLSAPALEAELYQASHAALGALSTVTPAAGFPLRLQRAARLIGQRVALIGDAAHNVHPLAGQGVNLGFRDARELARVIAERGAQEDCGDFFLLRRYERARREDILAVEWTTDGLQRLFGASGRLVSRVRNLGLRAASGWTPLKNFLVGQAVR